MGSGAGPPVPRSTGVHPASAVELSTVTDERTIEGQGTAKFRVSAMISQNILSRFVWQFSGSTRQ